MTRSLPAKPSLEQLKKQARNILKSHKRGDTTCCAVLKNLDQFKDKSDRAILKAGIGLQDAQFALSLEYGFKNWGEMKRTVLGREDSRKYLHIHCGDASAQTLRNSSVTGDINVWREIYVEGPVPGNVSENEFRKVRAGYLSASMNLEYRGVLQGINARYKMLAEADRYGEVILWFDSCMFDQTILIHLLDLCAKQDWPETALSLICIDRGLGELYPEELAALMDRKHLVTPGEIMLAQNAWSAFTSANPEDIETIVKGDCSALPYLADALYRHLEQYPSVHNGLDRTQNQILKAVAAGTTRLIQIFTAVAAREERPFMGDTSLWRIIDELAGNKVPFVTLAGPGRLSDYVNLDPELYDAPSLKDLKRWDVSITDAGKSVLAGEQDAIALNGVDRHLGGVHLSGTEAQWRWDEQDRRLVGSTI